MLNTHRTLALQTTITNITFSSLQQWVKSGPLPVTIQPP